MREIVAEVSPLIGATCLAWIAAFAQPAHQRAECLKAFPMFALALCMTDLSCGRVAPGLWIGLVSGAGVIGVLVAARDWPKRTGPALGMAVTGATGTLYGEGHHLAGALLVGAVTSVGWLGRRAMGRSPRAQSAGTR